MSALKKLKEGFGTKKHKNGATNGIVDAGGCVHNTAVVVYYYYNYNYYSITIKIDIVLIACI